MAGRAPWWSDVLQMAEDWGRPPYLIMTDQGVLPWFFRWRAFTQGKAAQVDQIQKDIDRGL